MDRQALKDFVFQKYGLKFKRSASAPEGTEILSVNNEPAFVVLATNKSLIDFKCPNFAETIRNLPNFQDPRLVRDQEWVETNLNEISNHDLQNILDYAFKAATNGNQTFVAQQLVYLPGDNVESQYQEQKVPHAANRRKRQAPASLQKMMESYDYTIMPADVQGVNFYRQGQLVADYEDDYDQIYEFKRYYPDYHAMTVHQLRTYFTWRTQLRKGKFTVSSTSYAYVYIYELLNNIGVANPAEGYEKLIEFSQRYADNYGQHMQDYLHQWLQDYVLYYGLDRAKANTVFADQLAVDRDYHLMLHPADYPAKELLTVLLAHCPYLEKCRLYQKSPDEWGKVVKVVWQHVLEQCPQAFTKMVASRTETARNFFGGAVFAFHEPPRLQKYPIDSERQYQIQDRKYYCRVWYPRKDQKKQLNAFFHELDRLARQEFHLGHPLKARPMDEQVLQAILEGIRLYQRQRADAQRPHVKINLADLDQIRADASTTRDSLLTDEEKQDDATAQVAKPVAKEPTPLTEQPAEEPSLDSNDVNDELNLTADERYLLLALLNHQPYQEYLQSHHLMASILVDAINEKLFDEIGDAVIDFNDQDQPVIIEDYEPDLNELIKGDWKCQKRNDGYQKELPKPSWIP